MQKKRFRASIVLDNTAINANTILLLQLPVLGQGHRLQQQQLPTMAAAPG